MTVNEFYDLRISMPEIFDPEWGLTTIEIEKALLRVEREEAVENAYKFILLTGQRPWHLAHIINAELFMHDHKP